MVLDSQVKTAETRSKEAHTSDQTSRKRLTKNAYLSMSRFWLCKITSKAHRSCWECSTLTSLTIHIQSAESAWNLMSWITKKQHSGANCVHLSVPISKTGAHPHTSGINKQKSPNETDIASRLIKMSLTKLLTHLPNFSSKGKSLKNKFWTTSNKFWSVPAGQFYPAAFVSVLNTLLLPAQVSSRHCRQSKAVRILLPKLLLQ